MKGLFGRVKSNTDNVKVVNIFPILGITARIFNQVIVWQCLETFLVIFGCPDG